VPRNETEVRRRCCRRHRRVPRTPFPLAAHIVCVYIRINVQRTDTYGHTDTATRSNAFCHSISVRRQLFGVLCVCILHYTFIYIYILFCM